MNLFPLAARLRAALTLVTGTAVLLAACAPASQAPAAATSAPSKSAAQATTAPAAGATTAAKPAAGGLSGTAKIGAAFSQTGGAAQYGATQKNGVQMAVEEINAAKALGDATLEVVYEDDASDKAQGINVFQKFINQDRVVAILGPTLSNTAQAADPVAQSAGVPILGVSNTAGGITEIGDFIFRDSLTEAQVIPQTVQAVKQGANVQKAALMYGNDDAFTKAGYDVMLKALQDNGIQVASEQTFAKGDKDFAAQLTVIRDGNPDALFVSALVDEATGIVTQARRLGLEKTPIIGGNGFNSPALMKNSGPAAEGVIVGAAWNAASTNPRSQDFIKGYQAKFSSDPDQFAAQAYAGVYILTESMKNGKSVTDRKALRDGLAQVKDLDTVLGKFSFTAERDADHAAVVQIVKDGTFVVYP